MAFRQQLSRSEKAIEASKLHERDGLAKSPHTNALGPDPETAGVLRQEIQRIEASVVELQQVIAAMLQEPIVELGKVARKNLQLGELNAYLKGLKFTASLLGM